MWTTIKDERGSTYVQELPAPFTTPGYGGTATHVCRWYNADERSWVVSYSDAQGQQVGSSEYVYSKQESLDEAEGLVKASLSDPKKALDHAWAPGCCDFMRKVHRS